MGQLISLILKGFDHRLIVKIRNINYLQWMFNVGCKGCWRALSHQSSLLLKHGYHFARRCRGCLNRDASFPAPEEQVQRQVEWRVEDANAPAQAKRHQIGSAPLDEFLRICDTG